MKPPRSALPLPRYVERKPLKGGGWGFFFHVPSWARKAGCTVQSGPLGTDYDAAVLRPRQSCCLLSTLGEPAAKPRHHRQLLPLLGRSIGCLPNIAPTAATRN